MPDRGRGFFAHARAAERARDVPGQYANVVRQLEQSLEAVEEPFRAVTSVDGEVGTRCGADEQRVAGE